MIIKSIPGFPEFTPDKQVAMDKATSALKKIFNLYAYTTIDTPIVERNEIFEAEKGRDLFQDYNIYTLKHARGNNNDSQNYEADEDLSLRYDLTVPLARYVSQHRDSITFPFRRCHIAPVWRGEVPNNNHYRQFYQADFDIIGDGPLNTGHDAEILQITNDLLRAIGIGDVLIKVSNRKILRGIFRYYGCKEEDLHWAIGVIDDHKDLASEKVLEKLFSLLTIPKNEICTFLKKLLTARGTKKTLAFLDSLSVTDSEFISGVNELKELNDLINSMDADNFDIVLDLTIARSHDYYTGMIFETELVLFPDLGSVCSGGRYDSLTTTLSSHKMPGVGASIGLTRLACFLIESGHYLFNVSTTGIVFIADNGQRNKITQYKIADELRCLNINTEVSHQNKSIEEQINYAVTKGFRLFLLPKDNMIECINISPDSSAIRKTFNLDERSLGVFKNEIVNWFSTLPV